MTWLKSRKRWQRMLLVVAASLAIIGILELVLPKEIMEKAIYVWGFALGTYFIMELGAPGLPVDVKKKKSK